MTRNDVEATDPAQPTELAQPTDPAHPTQATPTTPPDLTNARMGAPGSGSLAVEPEQEQGEAVAPLQQAGPEPQQARADAPIDPSDPLDARVARAVERITPDALGAWLDALPGRLTTDSTQTVARRVVLARERLSQALRESLEALAAPIVALRERLLFMPVAGALDAERGRALTEQLLAAIHARRARAAVMDLTNATVDDATPVAARLTHAVRAARLLGAHVIITGASPALARSVASRAADPHAPRGIAANLSEGIREAERLLDHNVSMTTMTTIAHDARWSTENA